MLRIAIGSDHGGVDQKDEVVKYLKSKGYEVVDLYHKNILVNKDDMTLIDIDLFHKVSNDSLDINMFRYKQLIKRVLYQYLVKYNITDLNKAYKLLLDLIDENTYNLDNFNKVMKKVNKPIDYFNKVIK